MRTTIVPAQVTSVEDKIAGNLSFAQMLLLIAPVFIGGALFVFLPPFVGFRIYKLAIALVIAFVAIVLAVRIRGKLILEWITILGRYNLRPRYWVYDKNSHASRPVTIKQTKQINQEVEGQDVEPEPKHFSFSHQELLAFETAVDRPEAEFHFKRNKKGGLSVGIKRAN